MVGSKIDLEEKRSVPKDEAEKLSSTFDLKGYFECSSITGEGVEDVFEYIAKKIIEKSD